MSTTSATVVVVVVLVDVALVALVLEEHEPVAAWGHLEVQFKEGVGEEKAIPSLADTASSEESRWRKERYDTVKKPLRELAPYPAVHPWSAVGACGSGDTAATTSTTTDSERVRERRGHRRVKTFHLCVFGSRWIRSYMGFSCFQWKLWTRKLRNGKSLDWSVIVIC